MMTYACCYRALNGSLPVSGAVALDHEDLVNSDSEYGRKDHKVVDRWHAVTVLPLVDRLWVCESEDRLEVSYGDARGYPEVLDVLPCCCEVDDRDFHYTDRSYVHCWSLLSGPAEAGQLTGLACLVIENRFKNFYNVY